MSDVMADAEIASSSNPAGRVVKCLAPLISPAQHAISGTLAKVLGLEISDPQFPIACAQLRAEAYAIPAKVEKYLTVIPGARRSFEGFESIQQLADALLRTDSATHQWMLQAFTEKGWSALCWADEILTHYEAEPVIEEDKAAQLLSSVRELIDQILDMGDEFTQEETQHMLGLLRSLEDALVGMRIRGSGPVDRAFKAVMGDAVAHPDLWNREGGRRRKAVIAGIVNVVVSIAALLGAYPGGKELAGDLFPQLAITATAPEPSGSRAPVTGPVVEASAGPQEAPR